MELEIGKGDIGKNRVSRRWVGRGNRAGVLRGEVKC